MEPMSQQETLMFKSVLLLMQMFCIGFQWYKTLLKI